jgi:preprotein translocase subunit YajC
MNSAILKLSRVAVLLCPALTMAQAAGGDPMKSMFGSVLPMMLVMFAIIYFLMIRPEQKKQKARLKMINEMKKGDKVLTIGGMYGTVAGFKDDIINVKIADNTVVDVAKSAVSSVVTKDGAVIEPDKDAKK